MTRKLTLLAPALMLAACSYNPVIDPNTSAHPENYQAREADDRPQLPQGTPIQFSTSCALKNSSACPFR